MGDLPTEERNVRHSKVKENLDAKSLDAALIYYDEFNIANGWYLTGWGGRAPTGITGWAASCGSG
jgi:hypothetical protein